MPKLKSEQLPKCRHHKASGQTVVTLDGQDHYLGTHGTKASTAEYNRHNRLTSLWLANGRRLPVADGDMTIVEMLAAFRRFAAQHYKKQGNATRSIGNLDDAIRAVKHSYGHELVRDFGPLKLKALQAVMVTGFEDAKGKAFGALSRGVANRRVGIIKRVFRWAVSEEMAPPALAHALTRH